MPVDPRHPAHALAKALTGPTLSAPYTRLDGLRRLAVLCRTPAVRAALLGEANALAEVEWIVVALEALVLDAEVALADWERRAAAAPTPVAIIVQGGVVQEVCSAVPLPQLRFEVLDYDVDSSDLREADSVPFTDGTEVGAWRYDAELAAPADIDWVRFDADPA